VVISRQAEYTLTLKPIKTLYSKTVLGQQYNISNIIQLAGRPGGDRRSEARACEWKWLCALTSLYTGCPEKKYPL